MSRVEIRLGGKVFDNILSAEIKRDLEEMAGGFTIELADHARISAALPSWWLPPLARGPLAPGERIEILLDKEVVLIGWIDTLKIVYGADRLLFTLTGRDVTGDLVDCAAAPNGPAEYSNLTLTEICARICRPFGITVTADTDVGARFPKYGIEPAETAISAIEKACRQRAVLAMSDGVGGLRLTRGGRTKAPAPLVFGGNISTLDTTFNHSERFAEYILKGQVARGRAGAGTAMRRNTAAPSTPPPPASRPAATSTAGARPRVVMTARALDLAVTRYRPNVSMAKTQSGGATVQQQADWLMRTHRAKAEKLRAVVPDWRAGKDDRLWRINERVMVDDPLSQASAELLVAGLVWKMSRDGETTEMKLCGCDAFDVLLEPADTRRASQPRQAGTNNTTPEPSRQAPSSSRADTPRHEGPAMNHEDAGLARAQISRAVVHRVDDDGGSQLLDIESHEGITRSDVEVLQPYGLASRPSAGALTIVLAIGGDPTDLVALPSAGGARLGVEEGEVALYTDEASRVHLRAGGIVEIAAATELVATVGGTVFRVTADGVEILGNLMVAGNITATGSVSDGAGNLR